MAVLSDAAGRNRAAQLAHQRLHPVADAQHREAALQGPVRDARRPGVIHAGRPAGQDDAPGVEMRHGRRIRGGRDNLGINLQFPDAAGNQVGVLGAEVDDDDGVGRCCGHNGAAWF